MDFLKILRSIEELLYEVMSWMVFYPLTLWQSLRHPLRTMKYSDAEQAEKPEQQYLETLSPPLFLVLSILLAYWVEIATGAPEPYAVGPEDGIGRTILGSAQYLMAFRAVTFGVLPLLFAVAFLRCSDRRLDRANLRTPFFSQCYPGGVFAILASIGVMLTRFGPSSLSLAGTVVLIAALVWYVVIQKLWFMRIPGMTSARAIRVVAGAFAASLALILLIGLVASFA